MEAKGWAASLILDSNEAILGACRSILDDCEICSEESLLLSEVDRLPLSATMEIVKRIREGEDVLGDSYMRANSRESLRFHGETYTPDFLVSEMVSRASTVRNPRNIVDMGCGSGRFARACAERFPSAKVIAIDSSPFATLMAKATFRAVGLEDRIEVRQCDFTKSNLSALLDDGPTLWIGNPPYVRHHDIPKEKKEWLISAAKSFGYKASALSGLHVYFFLAVAENCKDGDFGVVVTSAEWLDSRYGALPRSLLAERLGVISLALNDRGERVFDGVDTTSIVSLFDISTAHELGRSVELRYRENGGENVRKAPLAQLRASRKWSGFFFGRNSSKKKNGYVRLGDIARVHRGIATGANKFWVRSKEDAGWMKYSVPVVSHARQVSALRSGDLSFDDLDRLLTLPCDVDSLSGEDAEVVRRVIENGRQLGIDKGCVARSRKHWWSIPAGEPAAILMTYMSRKPPVFVVNSSSVRSLNVVHGIYPTVALSEHAVKELVEYLNMSVTCDDGRTYCGGLTKFEPKEAEEILVPAPDMLEEGSWRL